MNLFRLFMISADEKNMSKFTQLMSRNSKGV